MIRRSRQRATIPARLPKAQDIELEEPKSRRAKLELISNRLIAMPTGWGGRFVQAAKG
ncbi:hypothetical protein ACFOJE_18225 [Azotobacter bryophylli]|uniref:Uncharacterized protein n=1 Tax=Azotobacter bryophylli TaxID=1986537 RepID=A0ABV7AX29_9GAMM